jgi:signal recognition particle subunit SRP54
MGDIVSLVERAQEKMDLEETEKMAERMLSGQFTMDDMLKQFEQIQKLGPLSGIMKMLPGMNQYAGLLDEAKAGDAMKHTKAIIQSMTPYERAHPEKLRGTMKKRIAKGSGTTVNEVNKLINQFSRVKKQIDQLGALNRSGSLNEESLEKMMNNVQNQMDDPRLQQQMKELQARNKKFRF